MQQLFYENYEQNKKGYIRDLHSSKIHRAITLHPNKNPPYQYRLHSYMLSRKIAELRHRTIQLHREIVLMSKYSSTEIQKEDLQLGIPPSRPARERRSWSGSSLLGNTYTQPQMASLPAEGWTQHRGRPWMT